MEQVGASAGHGVVRVVGAAVAERRVGGTDKWGVEGGRGEGSHPAQTVAAPHKYGPGRRGGVGGHGEMARCSMRHSSVGPA
eukprot:scaffold12957_cov92-Isochrysis_galbana.AAC.1